MCKSFEVSENIYTLQENQTDKIASCNVGLFRDFHKMLETRFSYIMIYRDFRLWLRSCGYQFLLCNCIDSP